MIVIIIVIIVIIIVIIIATPATRRDPSATTPNLPTKMIPTKIA